MMRITRRAAVLLTVAAVFAGLLAASGSSAPQQRQTIKYATSFGTFGRDAFVYVAMEKGYFRDAGFDVQVVPGLGTDNARLLASGQIDYSGSETTGNMVGRVSGGFPVKIVAITSQATQAAIATLAESNIASPKALEGKSLADLPSSIVVRLFPFYAKRAGIDASKVNILPGTPQTLPSLLATGRVDSIGQFTVGVPTLVKAAGGRQVKTFKYSQYLKGLLGNAIVTTDDRIKNKPDEVRAFTKAILKGLNYAIHNPGESGYIMQKYVPIADPVAAANELRILKFFVENKCTRKYGIGYIDVQKIKSTASIVRNAFKTTPFTYQDLYSTAFVKTASCNL
ncbi:MAG TPA: ABC transporter substrate-binding protein [Gaiellaceae bacterium]|nr:ABC transporter substrate-binding protein [Gaiellaceae bacterium]